MSKIESEIIELLSIFLDSDSITIDEFESMTKIKELCSKVQNKHEFDIAFKIKSKKKSTTDLTEDRWGVHRTHCCVLHGCKYGTLGCPVELAIIKQDFRCAVCYGF